MLEHQEQIHIKNPVGDSTEATPFENSGIEETVDEYALDDDDLYRGERAGYIKRRDELADIFDKGRVALAGGSIALSATVMKDLAPKANDGTKTLLVSSWMFLTASLVCSLIAVYLAAMSHDRQRCILDDDRLVGDGKARRLRTGRKNGFNDWLKWLNPGSIALLLVGIVLLGATFSNAFSSSATSNTGENNVSKNGSKGDGQKSLGASDRPITTTKPSTSSGGSNQSNGGNN